MDKPTYRLVGSPCGQHGQYTFYKALRFCSRVEKIVAIGDFFFVRIWQDSELVSIGELQLLWTDRVSDQTLVSLRLYFLPENTPDGRHLHGEDEVLAINDKVVLKAEDLLSWVCIGERWTWGLRAVWRGACTPPGDAKDTSPLHCSKLDFSDVDKEKNAIVEDTESPGVIVFSYPRYCRYRALLKRLEGIQATWLRDSLVAALGGYAAPTKNTRILYCKDTFEYPELEGHEFVCNHLAPRLKGRPRGRRRRRYSHSSDRNSDSDSEEQSAPLTPQQTPRRLSLRNGAEKTSGDEEDQKNKHIDALEDRNFLSQLKGFYRQRNEPLKAGISLKELSLRCLYTKVLELGGYVSVCRNKRWRNISVDCDYDQNRPAATRKIYERFLLPFENYERNIRAKLSNGKVGLSAKDAADTIDVSESPLREYATVPIGYSKSLRTPSPSPTKYSDKPEDLHVTTKPAEELNREFLESLPVSEGAPKIAVKPVEALRYPEKKDVEDKFKYRESDLSTEKLECNYLNMSKSQELVAPSALSNLSSLTQKYMSNLSNGTLTPLGQEQVKVNRPTGVVTGMARSSLRSVRVKPAANRDSRGLLNSTSSVAPIRPDSASSSPPVITNFGINYPIQQQEQSDDEIVEVPYKPKTPEIIDLDEYPESPQAVKKKKLDILKERGLEVTAVPASVTGATWPQAMPLLNQTPVLLHPAMQHQIMTQAQLFQIYNMMPQTYVNGTQPPKIIQAKSIFGSTGPEKTVYGNPKDPFMPPPHILQGTPIKPARNINTPQSQDVLDLTCKDSLKPAVEIVRVPNVQTPPKVSPQSSAAKNYTLLDGKAVVGSNLEITLVSPKNKTKPQKRSSNGKFMSNKAPSPPKDKRDKAIIIPSYPIRDDPSPTSSSSSRDSVVQNLQVKNSMSPLLDPMYINAFYNSLAGQLDPRQLAMYRELMTNQFTNYSGILNNVGAITNTPTTKN